jgi:2-oxoglutarate dehydrogenase E2 component (dihydrolipoamide succinyltransferase)
MIDEKEMITYDFCDISIAVSGPKGLMVPVMRNVENMTFRGVESEVKRLAIRARDGQITVDEMTGGTFTISNGGVFGSMLSQHQLSIHLKVVFLGCIILWSVPLP